MSGFVIMLNDLFQAVHSIISTDLKFFEDLQEVKNGIEEYIKDPEVVQKLNKIILKANGLVVHHENALKEVLTKQEEREKNETA